MTTSSAGSARKLPMSTLHMFPPLMMLAIVLAVAAGTLAHAQTFTTLYPFGGSSNDPIEFVSPDTLAQGQDGNIYSTGPTGGTLESGYAADGAVFYMTTGGALSLLYTFEVMQGVNGGGVRPVWRRHAERHGRQLLLR